MNTKNRIKTVLTAMAIVVIAATPALADLAAGVTLDFNASDPASGTASSWNSLTADSTRNWSFGGDVTLESITTARVLTKAYRFTGVTGSSASSWDKFNENEDTTWELWIKPADTGDDNQIIFETGGSGDGMAIWYVKGTDSDNSGTVNFTIDDGSVQSTVSVAIDTTEFCQITAVYDRDSDGGSVDLIQVYVDGVLAGDNTAQSPTEIHDWAGSDGATLGSNGGLANGVLGGQYEGDIAVLRFWELKALTTAEVEANYDLLDVADPMDPNPSNGAQVSASSTQVLSWTNLPPTTGSDVWVDVYFGTDANALDAIATDPADGLNVTSVTVDASVIGQTYHWQVDSYINGSKTGDPNESLYTFYAVDFPPSLVDAGVDMITWYGQGVQLDATVEDDGVSALTYLWSADPDDGVVFSDETAEDPIVTISKASYSAARIVNAGFEANQGVDGDWPDATGWAGGGAWNPPDIAPPAGYEELGDGYTGSAVPEGNMCGWTAGTISQVLAETLAADTQYELTVQVGNSKTYEWTGYNVQLLAGGTVLVEDVDTVEVPFDNWALVTVPFNSTGVDPALVGQPLEIRLLALDLAVADYAECNFDDVVLTADPGFPAPAVGIVELTLDVSGVADTMMIDVYGDACKAAIGAGFDPIDLTDHDGNCITGFEDLVRMVAVWLDDYSLTEPAVKP